MFEGHVGRPVRVRVPPRAFFYASNHKASSVYPFTSSSTLPILFSLVPSPSVKIKWMYIVDPEKVHLLRCPLRTFLQRIFRYASVSCLATPCIWSFLRIDLRVKPICKLLIENSSKPCKTIGPKINITY